MNKFAEKNQHYQNRINSFLADFLAANYVQSSRLIEALSYSLLSDGKRIRPLLIYATSEALGMEVKQVDYIAASVEMIHAYSLIHDDLPTMDDDDIRRGNPTCHVKFDEATAILAGDALQAMAFEVLSKADIKANIIIELVKKLSFSCGAYGMAGGQSLDLESEDKQLDKTAMDNIHQLKTGALISAAVEMVGLLDCDYSNTIKLALKEFAYHFGMAFQIIDDVLDITGNADEIGKPIGSDVANKKSTYPTIMGLEASKKAAIEHAKRAITQLKHLPKNTEYLKYLAEYLVSRQS